MTTVFVQGSSGAIDKMDIPTDPHGAERFRDAVASQRFVIVPDDRVIESTSRWGGVVYVIDPSVAMDQTAVPAEVEVDEDGSPLQSQSKQDLFEVATELGIETKASWSKAQLIAAIDAAEVEAPGDVDSVEDPED